MTIPDATASAVTIVAAHLLAAGLDPDEALPFDAPGRAATAFDRRRFLPLDDRLPVRAAALRRLADHHGVAVEDRHWDGERYCLLTRAADVHALRGARIEDDAIDDAMAQLAAGWVPLELVDLDADTRSVLRFLEPVAEPIEQLELDG
ncbi:hypothetical protein [Patulibacter defluvii]|uniref:hypothetical protein n=1 Tax=Patulibacter defluvii TaxID=3095358 RepID=UPI002A748F08|nr:hypothetical protein [Patulibacter sp. DM4]